MDAVVVAAAVLLLTSEPNTGDECVLETSDELAAVFCTGNVAAEKVVVLTCGTAPAMEVVNVEKIIDVSSTVVGSVIVVLAGANVELAVGLCVAVQLQSSVVVLTLTEIDTSAGCAGTELIGLDDRSGNGTTGETTGRVGKSALLTGTISSLECVVVGLFENSGMPASTALTSIFFALSSMLKRLKIRGMRKDDAGPVKVPLKRGKAVETDEVSETVPLLETYEVTLLVMVAVLVLSAVAGPGAVVTSDTLAVTMVDITTVVVSLPGTMAGIVLKTVVVDVELVYLGATTEVMVRTTG
jgi:hypothetical protein